MDLDVFEWVGTRVSMSLGNATAVVQFFNPPYGYMDEAMEAELALVLGCWCRRRFDPGASFD